MNRLATDVKDALLLYLTPSGRAQARRLRDAKTDEILAAHRLEVAEILADIGSYHLKLADLTRQRLTADRPALVPNSQLVIDSLARAIGGEIDRYARRQHREVSQR